jgi:hypothetical protein
MKAAYTRYGPPDVVQIMDMEGAVRLSSRWMKGALHSGNRGATEINEAAD